jgi:hypothetical protein
MQFYILTNPEPDSPQDRRARIDVISADGSVFGDAPRCRACGRALGGKVWLPPYRIELETSGMYYGDLAFKGNDIVVSDRFVRVYQENRLTGLSEFVPVEIVKAVHRLGRPREERPEYFKARVSMSQTTVDQEASEMEWAPDGTDLGTIENTAWSPSEVECAVCLNRKGIFVRYKRMIIRPESWTGEDIFLARGGPTRHVISSTFKETCREHGMNGAVFIPAESEEAGWDHYPSDATRLQRILRDWENTSLTADARRDAYATLVFWITNDRSLRQKADFDPDTDFDPKIIESARSIIAAGLKRH